MVRVLTFRRKSARNKRRKVHLINLNFLFCFGVCITLFVKLEISAQCNSKFDAKGNSYYLGCPHAFMESKFQHTLQLVRPDIVTMKEVLLVGRKQRDTPSKDRQAVPGVAPTWVNPESGLSLKFPPEVCIHGQDIIQKAVNTLPTKALQGKHDETTRDLVERIRQCDLDNAHYRNFGRAGHLVTRLNELPHPQPKRLTMSAVADFACTQDIPGIAMWKLLIYGSAGRPMEDWRCRPITREVFMLGIFLWRMTYHHLTDLSKVFPPNSCQINFYYSTFGGKMREHRDNGIRDNKGRVHNMSTPRSENSQVHGTNVLSFTVGDTMKFKLSRSVKRTTGYHEKRTLECDDGMTMELEHGSCFLLHPHDDENFKHSAWFPRKSKGLVRVSFNFRWCQNLKWFHSGAHPIHSLEHALASQLEMRDKQIHWRFLLEGKERNYNKKEWEEVMKRKKCSNQFYFNS